MKPSKANSPKKNISRTDFLKKAVIATTGFYILPRFVLGGKGYVAPSDKLYIAAIGCGGEGVNDIRHFATAPNKNAEIAFLCDVDDRQGADRRSGDASLSSSRRGG